MSRVDDMQVKKEEGPVGGSQYDRDTGEHAQEDAGTKGASDCCNEGDGGVEEETRRMATPDRDAFKASKTVIRRKPVKSLRAWNGPSSKPRVQAWCLWRACKVAAFKVAGLRRRTWFKVAMPKKAQDGSMPYIL